LPGSANARALPADNASISATDAYFEHLIMAIFQGRNVLQL
jgi:hypothetical protein